MFASKQIFALVFLAIGALGDETDLYYGKEGADLVPIPVDNDQYAALCDTPEDGGAVCIHMSQGDIDEIQVFDYINGMGDDIIQAKIYAKSNKQDFGVLLENPNRYRWEYTLYLKGNDLKISYASQADHDNKLKTFQVNHHGIDYPDYWLVVKNEQDVLVADKDQAGTNNQRWIHLELTQG